MRRTAPGGAATEDEVLLRFDPRWVRYAPLTTSGTVIAAAIFAALGQFANGIANRLSDDTWVVRYVEDNPVTTAVAAVVAFLVLGAVFAVLGYLVQNWGFTLARDVRGRTFHVRRGLLTTRETSLEVPRVRGLEVGEPLGLRLLGAARLGAVVTGVSKKESGTTLLVPAAPRGIIDTTGSSTIGTSEPLHLALQAHGPRARRRRYTRALAVAALLPLLVLLVAVSTSLPLWTVLPALLSLPVAAAIAADRYRAARSRPDRRLPRRALGHVPRSSRRAAAHRDHRLEPAPVVVPATCRSVHPRRHDGGRAPGLRGDRRTGGPRCCARRRGRPGTAHTLPRVASYGVFHGLRRVLAIRTPHNETAGQRPVSLSVVGA